MKIFTDLESVYRFALDESGGDFCMMACVGDLEIKGHVSLNRCGDHEHVHIQTLTRSLAGQPSRLSQRMMGACPN